MLSQIKESYTEDVLLLAKKNQNILDDFDEISSKIELFSALDFDENEPLKYAIYMYSEWVKEHLKSIEYKLKIAKIKGNLGDILF